MKKYLIVTAIMALALFLASCGGNGPSSRMHLVMTDFEFTPSEFTVIAGDSVELSVQHDGVVDHNFIIMKYGTDAGHSFDEEDQANVYWKLTVHPGESRDLAFTAPDKPGVYQIICGMPGHLQSGMVGKLTVVAP
jgi:uncharacterized cupredoxin-like copper-binding protein